MLNGYRHLPALVFFCLSPFTVKAGNPDDVFISTFHSTAAEVRVTFFATDETSHAVDRITPDDFAIVDGELIIRQFRSLSRSEETAIRAVILIDSSGSVAKRLTEVERQIVGMLTQDQLSAGELSLVSFSGLQPVLLCKAKCQTVAAQKLTSLTASGPTPLFDSITYGANLLSRPPLGKRLVLILFSDGDDTISRHSASEALQSLIDSGTLLYAVDMNTSGRPDGSALLQQMARATGGRYFSSVKDALTVLPSVFEDLLASWVVTYEPPDTTPGFHSLRMLPKHNLNLRFHCRSGYYYGMNAP